MNYRDWTWVIIGLELLGVEIFALINKDPLLTDSMREGSNRWMLWPALFGTMCGHFFGSRGGPSWGPAILIVLALAVVYRDLAMRDAVPTATHMEIFLVFLGLGSWFWGSR